MSRWRKLLAPAAVGVALCCPAAALAEGEPETGGYGAFVLKASHGYRIFVLAFSGPAFRNGEVLISVARGGASVAYLAPATVTDTAIEASLGRLGKLDLGFNPSGEQGVLRPRCESDEGPTNYEKGTYAGAVEFRGEEGYTNVSATRVPFSIAPLAALSCLGPITGEEVGADLPGAKIAIRSRRGTTKIAMKAIQNRPGARLQVEASIEEQVGETIVAREVEATYPAVAFKFDPRLRFAQLRPGVPFSGAATFRRAAEKGKRLTGGLTVDFPGRSNVKLTGAGFRTKLVHARTTRESSNSTGFSRPSLLRWPSTKSSPTAFATPSLLAPK